MGLSRAIMDCPRHFKEIAWLLRWNPYDPDEADAALRAAAGRLIEFGHPMTLEAARWLLEALATPVAVSTASRLLRKTQAGPEWPTTVRVEAARGVVHWDYAAALAWPASKAAPLTAARELQAHALDPELSLPGPSIDVLRGLATGSKAGAIWTAPGTTRHDLALEEGQTVLARWAPDALGDLLRRVFATVPERTSGALEKLAREVPEHLLLLDAPRREVVADAVDRLMVENGKHDMVFARLLLARLAERPAADQIAVLSALPTGPVVATEHRRILAAPTAADFEVLAGQLHPQTSTEHLVRWLYYLSLVPLEVMPKGYPPLATLVGHPDAKIRRWAFEVILNSRDPALASVVGASGWRFTPGMDRLEAAYGSLVLCQAASNGDHLDVTERIDPQALGALAVQRSTAEDMDAFAGFVRDSLNSIARGGGPRSIPSFWTNSSEALDLLVARRGEEVAAWLEPLLEDDRGIAHGALAESFPFIGLCRALLRVRSKLGARLWSRLLDLHDTGFFKAGELEALPFAMADGPEADGLRGELLKWAKTDLHLAKIAEAAIEHDRHAWVMRCIAGDLTATNAGRIGRGLTLAGLLDATAEADALWRSQLAFPPAGGWLSQVHERARCLYRRNRWAHHWFDRFVAERNRDRAFGHHLLFVACADRRALAWAPQRITPTFHDLPEAWRNHWSLCWPGLVAHIRKIDDKQKKRLYGQDTVEQTQAPWL